GSVGIHRQGRNPEKWSYGRIRRYYPCWSGIRDSQPSERNGFRDCGGRNDPARRSVEQLPSRSCCNPVFANATEPSPSAVRILAVSHLITLASAWSNVRDEKSFACPPLQPASVPQEARLCRSRRS